jgi:hypothetical protein
LLIIWIGLLVEILLLVLIKPLVINYQFVSLIAVSIHLMVVTIIIFSKQSSYRFIFLSAFFIRVIFMIWDIYARNIFVLPHSGSDTEYFYFLSIFYSENLSSINNISSEYYPKLLGFLFYMIGPQRIIAQYINVLLGLSVVLMLFKILNLLKIKKKISQVILLVAALFPNSIVLSSILLRELFPTFFVICSLYFFIKWFKHGRSLDFFISLTMLGIASVFHSGVIGIYLGYAFVFIFYDKENNRFKTNLKSSIASVFISAIGLIIYTQFKHIFLWKFGDVENLNDIYLKSNNTLDGGSDYLRAISIQNSFDLVIYGPLRLFYFLTSPLPTSWRGFFDVFAFFSDSILYLFTLIYISWNWRRYGEGKNLIISILLIIICVSFVFGLGVDNAGTAIRHRQKILPIFLVLLAVMFDQKQKYIKNL